MRNIIFENNYKLLKKYNDVNFEKEDYAVKSKEYLTVVVENKEWYLQSRVNMDEAVSAWCDQFENITYLNSFMIFGFGDSRYIRELSQRYPDNSIVIYEPCEEILAEQMCQEDMSDIFMNPNIKIAVGKNKRQLLELLFRKFISFRKIDNVRYAVIPNYTKICKDQYTDYVRQIKEYVNKDVMSRNTFILRENCRAKNFLYNLDCFWREAGTVELKRALSIINRDKYTAVLVAAGPSLDKNIEQLLNYKDKVFIVCVDAALRAMLKHGIRPDIIVTQDPEFKDPSIFDNVYAEEIPVVVSVTSDFRMVKKCHGRKFYIYEGGLYLDYLMEETRGELYELHTGGSVANTAFSLICHVAEFKNIILIGQDLGYPGNKKHAGDVFYDEKEIDENTQSGYFYVDARDGGKVLTEGNMNMYRLWFESMIVDYPELNVIDATEGGALIHGTITMKLGDALLKYGDVDACQFEKIINQADYLFDSDEKNLIELKINNTYNSIDKIIEKLSIQNKKYDELDMLNRGGKYNSKAFKRCVKEIGDFHDWALTDKELDLVRMYTNKEEYFIMDQMQKQVSNTYEEIKLIVKSGKKLVQAYIDGAEKLKKQWQQIRQEES